MCIMSSRVARRARTPDFGDETVDRYCRGRTLHDSKVRLMCTASFASVVGASYSRTPMPSRRGHHARRARRTAFRRGVIAWCAWTMAVALVALGFGVIPSAGGFAAGRDAARAADRFPCENAPCGCGSPERCWQTCCCNTPELRLAWCLAEAVVPPSYAVLPRGWSPERIRSAIAAEESRSSASARRTAHSERPACCGSADAAAEEAPVADAAREVPSCTAIACAVGVDEARSSCCSVERTSACASERPASECHAIEAGLDCCMPSDPLSSRHGSEGAGAGDGQDPSETVGIPVGGTREKCRGGAGDGTGLGIVLVLPPPVAFLCGPALVGVIPPIDRQAPEGRRTPLDPPPPRAPLQRSC